MELVELFHRVFFTRAGLLRLVFVVVAAAIVGIILGATGASSGIRSLTIIIGAVLAGALMFVPAYRKWLREQN